MSAHPTLFDPPKSRHRDPQTSKAAAGKVWGGWADQIVENYALQGPATDDQLCLRMNVSPRRWPTIKTARSRVTHAEDPNKRLIVSTGLVEDGQTVWCHRDYRGVENVPVKDVL